MIVKYLTNVKFLPLMLVSGNGLKLKYIKVEKDGGEKTKRWLRT